MKHVYLNAIVQLERRAATCLKASKKPNNMADCGWSDLRHVSYWLMELSEAAYRIETIKQRISK